jgi:hypothetical protein
VALALAQIAPLLTPKSVSHLITFFVSVGLGDRSPEVRKNMLAAALAAVDLHGKVRYRTYCYLLECVWQLPYQRSWSRGYYFFISGDFSLETGYLMSVFAVFLSPSTDYWDNTLK